MATEAMHEFLNSGLDFTNIGAISAFKPDLSWSGYLKNKTTMKIQSALARTALIAALVGTCSLNAAYTGLSVGYMIDGENEIFSAQLGTTISEKGGISHNLEFEIAYTEDSEMGVSVDVLPLMVNYRAINKLKNNVDLYFGVGAGISMVDVSGYGISDDDSVFTVQAFVGGDIALSQAASLRLGYRYIYLDKVELFDIDVGDLDDSVLEIGIVFKF